MRPQQQPVIMCVGGGTLGPVLPLLAVLDEVRKKTPIPVRAVWVATPNGPEHAILQDEQEIEIYTLASPKLHRYFSLQNFLLPFALVGAIVRAWRLVRRVRPTVVVSAGGFTAAPVHFVAWLHRIPSHVHQQDVEVGLTNKIVGPMASSLTCAFPASKEQLPSYAVAVGNPVRDDVVQGNRARARARWHMTADRPTIVVLGGGLGAQSLNDAIRDGIGPLTTHAQVLHVTGKGKMRTDVTCKQYTQVEFLSRAEIADAYALADIVVARAGMGTMSELALLRKPTIFVPIPQSHQERNAYAVRDAGAAQVATAATVVATACELVRDEAVQTQMRTAWPAVLRTDAAVRIAFMVLHIISSRGR